mgnify:CR=1 FL=1
MIDNKTHQFFMGEALKQAKLSFEADEVPIGAVLVYQNKIIASGYNLSIANHDPTAHAEILTIRDAGQYLKNYRLLNCSLYVTLEPCVMCLGAIFHARISNLIFGAYDHKKSTWESVANLKENNKELNHHCVIHGGILEIESKTLLQNFFRNKRKKP